MLLPKRVKYRRVHRGRMTGKATRGNKVSYGDFGLQALEPTWNKEQLSIVAFVYNDNGVQQAVRIIKK